MKKLSYKELSLFTHQLHLILESGLSIEQSLEEISHDIEDKTFKSELEKIAKNYQSSYRLADSFASSQLFDQYFVEMVRIGEESGYLDKVMFQLSTYYQRMDTTQHKIKDAFMYPSILIVMMILVIGLLIIKVLPLFADVLANLGTSVSGFAMQLMNFSKGLSQFGIIFLIIFILFILYIFVLRKDNFLLTKKLKYELSLAQLSFALSLFVNAGMDIKDALIKAKGIVNNSQLMTNIDALVYQLNQDISFDKAIFTVPLFKSAYNRLLSTGFKTGKGDETLSKVAMLYEEEVNQSIDKSLDFIEPCLVAILSIIVGVILLAVMMPLTSIMSSL